MKTHIYKNARNLMNSTQKYIFDENIIRIRRSLLVASSLLVMLSQIVPYENSGLYEINVGVIKGSLERPWLIYVMALAVTVYYLLYFFFQLRKSAVANSINVFTQELFFYGVAESLANHEIREFWKDKNGTFHKPLSISFKAKYTSENIYIVESEGNLRTLDSDILTNIENSPLFSVRREGEAIKLLYSHEPSKEDYIVFSSYKDDFMRLKVADWFVSEFPLAFAMFSVVVGVSKVISLV